jgi:hypothetical protein
VSDLQGVQVKVTVFVDPYVTVGIPGACAARAAHERYLNKYVAKSIFWMMSRPVSLLYTL